MAKLSHSLLVEQELSLVSLGLSTPLQLWPRVAQHRPGGPGMCQQKFIITTKADRLTSLRFSRATATPQRSTSTCELDSTGNVEKMTASSLPSGGSPTSAVSPTASVPSPQDVRRSTQHAHAPVPSDCCKWPSMPLNSTKSCFPSTSGSYGHEATTNFRGASAAASEHRLGGPT